MYSIAEKRSITSPKHLSDEMLGREAPAFSHWCAEVITFSDGTSLWQTFVRLRVVSRVDDRYSYDLECSLVQDTKPQNVPVPPSRTNKND